MRDGVQSNGKPAWISVDAKLHQAVDETKTNQMPYVTVLDMLKGSTITDQFPRTGRVPVEDAI